MKMAKDKMKNIDTMIGADATVEGTLSLEGGIVIYGKVNGNVITAGPCRVAQGGTVTGEIRASEAHIGGKVEGNVISEGRAVLGSSAELKGDLVYSSLVIEEGAQFEGRCGIIRENPEPAAEPELPLAEPSE
jgi:cytoskeletal protein CcmA (bactofilin family)